MPKRHSSSSILRLAVSVGVLAPLACSPAAEGPSDDTEAGSLRRRRADAGSTTTSASDAGTDSAASTATSTGPGPTVTATASRTSCVAPCAVFFDALGTTSTTTGRPFHELDFTWDFADTTAGTWATTGRSKNVAKGAVASHVFRSAGAYQVTVSVRDASGGVSTAQLGVTVADANETFSGAKTHCVSISGNFVGCPAGAQQVTSSDLGAQIAWLNSASGQRLLLCGGDSWSTSTSLTLTGTGPTQLGAYGTGKPTLSTPVNDDLDLVSVRQSNAVVSGLKLVGPSYDPNTTTRGVSLGTVGKATDHVLLLDNEVTNFPFLAVIVRESTTNDGIFMADNYFHHTGMYHVYAAGNRYGILGNRMEYTAQTHILRGYWTNKGIIGENVLRFPSNVLTSQGRLSLKFHAPRQSTGWPISQHAVISGNTLQGSVYVASLGPEDNIQGDPEVVDDIVFERNTLLAGPTTTNLVASMLHVAATNVTVRNNAFDTTTSKYGEGVTVGQMGSEPAPANTNILNNVFLRTDTGISGSEETQLTIGSECSNTTVRNNIASCRSSCNQSCCARSSASRCAGSAPTPFAASTYAW